MSENERSAMFPGDDAVSAEYLAAYRETWALLSPGLRERLLAGPKLLALADVDELLRLPHPMLTLTEWLDQPEGRRWNVSYGFVNWARLEAVRHDA